MLADVKLDFNKTQLNLLWNLINYYNVERLMIPESLVKPVRNWDSLLGILPISPILDTVHQFGQTSICPHLFFIPCSLHKENTKVLSAILRFQEKW